MDYDDFKRVPRTIASDKVLHEKVFNNIKMQNMMDINTDLLH